jgi:amidase
MNALRGFDRHDTAAQNIDIDYFKNGFNSNFDGVKLGVLKSLLSDSIYANTIEKLRTAGVAIVEITPPEVSLEGFVTLLNIDMKHDLPLYLLEQAGENISVKSVSDVVLFNSQDIALRAPYGQALFDGIIKDKTTLEELKNIKVNLRKVGKKYLKDLKERNLDAILSINNYHSSMAAAANYPTLTVPMAYRKSGEPISLTFIGMPFSERRLLEIGYSFEQLTKARRMPKNYQ